MSFLGSALPPTWLDIAAGTARTARTTGTDSTANQPVGTHLSVTIADHRDAEIAALKAALAASNAQNAHLQVRNAHLENEYAALLADAKARLAQGDIFLEARNREIAELTKKCEKGAKFINEGVKHYKDLQSRNAELRGQVSMSDSRISDLEVQLKQALDEISQLRTHPTINPDLEATNAQLQAKQCAYDERIANDAVEYNKVIDELIRQDATIAQLKTDYAKLEEYNLRLWEDNSQLWDYNTQLQLANEIGNANMQRLFVWVQMCPFFVPMVATAPIQLTTVANEVATAPIEPTAVANEPPTELVAEVAVSMCNFIALFEDEVIPQPTVAAPEPPTDGYPSSKEITDLILAHIDENKRKVEACQRNTPKDERKPMHHAIFDTRLMQEYVRSLSRNDQILLPGKVMKFIEQNCKPRHSAQEAGAYRKAKAKANSIKPSPPSPPTHLVSPVSPVTSMPNISIAIPGTWPMKFKEVSTIPSSTPDTASAAAGGSA